MLKQYDANLYIGDELRWGTLKYGLCSYFALAYAKTHPAVTSFLAIREYDEDMQKEYLVHYLVVQPDGSFLDAEGRYSKWDTSIEEMTDVSFMELRQSIVNKSDIETCIEEDMGFDTELFQTICHFVQEHY